MSLHGVSGCMGLAHAHAGLLESYAEPFLHLQTQLEPSVLSSIIPHRRSMRYSNPEGTAYDPEALTHSASGAGSGSAAGCSASASGSRMSSSSSSSSRAIRLDCPAPSRLPRFSFCASLPRLKALPLTCLLLLKLARLLPCPPRLCPLPWCWEPPLLSLAGCACLLPLP